MGISKKSIAFLYIFTAVLWIIFLLLFFTALGMFPISIDNETAESILFWMKISFSASVISSVVTIAVSRIIKEVKDEFYQLQQRISELERETEKNKTKQIANKRFFREYKIA